MVPRWEYWRGHFCSTLTIDIAVVNVPWTENNQLINYFTLWLNFTFLDIFMVTEQSRLFFLPPLCSRRLLNTISTFHPLSRARGCQAVTRVPQFARVISSPDLDTWHVTRDAATRHWLTRAQARTRRRCTTSTSWPSSTASQSTPTRGPSSASWGPPTR